MTTALRPWRPGRAQFVRKNVLSLASLRPALIESELNESEMSAAFIVTTADEDREHDTVRPNGCLEYLHEYKANPIVCFDHKQREVVGKSEDNFGVFHFQVRKNEIWAKCFFHDCMWKNVPIGIETFHLVRKKIFRGASPSFIPIESRARGRGEDAGVDYIKWRLTEWSICPLQSNQRALEESAADELRATLDRGEIRQKSFAADLRKRYLGPPKVWAPGVTIAFDSTLFTPDTAKRFLAARGLATVGDALRYPQSKNLSAMLLTTKGIKMEDETPPADADVTTDTGTDTEDVPADFETMAKYLVHFEHFLNDQGARDAAENPKTKELFEKINADVEQLMADIRAHADTDYGGQDLEGVADGYRPEDGAEEETPEPEPEPTPEEKEEITKRLAANLVVKRLSAENATEFAGRATETANRATELASGTKNDDLHDLAHDLHTNASNANEAAASSHKAEGNTAQAMHHTRLQISHDRAAAQHYSRSAQGSTNPVKPATRQKSLKSGVRKCMGAASSFLKSLPSKQVHKSLHADCLMHSKSLDDSMPGDDDGDEDEGGDDEVQKRLDSKAADLDANLAELNKLVAR